MTQNIAQRVLAITIAPGAGENQNREPHTVLLRSNPERGGNPRVTALLHWSRQQGLAHVSNVDSDKSPVALYQSLAFLR